MRGNYVARRVADVMDAAGETMTLGWPGGGSAAVKGKRFGSSVETVVNNQTRTTMTVKIGDAEVAASGNGPPKKKGSLTIAGRVYAIEEVDTRGHEGITVVHILRVTG